MIIVDNALRARETEGRPMRVALIGAGFMSHGLANHIVNTTQGMRLVGVYNRNPQRAFDLCKYAGLRDVVSPSSQAEVDAALRAGKTIVTGDPFLLARSAGVDVLVDITGSVEFGARVAFEAFRHGKDIVLMNAEIDATIGPILHVYAEKHGVIFSACDGDEPGVQINLYRWVKGLGLTPRVIGNVKGLQDPYRNPTTQKGWAGRWGPECRDGHLVRRRIEDQLRAIDRCQCDRLQGAFTRHVARTEVRSQYHGDSRAVRSGGAACALRRHSARRPGTAGRRGERCDA